MEKAGASRSRNQIIISHQSLPPGLAFACPHAAQYALGISISTALATPRGFSVGALPAAARLDQDDNATAYREAKAQRSETKVKQEQKPDTPALPASTQPELCGTHSSFFFGRGAGGHRRPDEPQWVSSDVPGGARTQWKNGGEGGGQQRQDNLQRNRFVSVGVVSLRGGGGGGVVSCGFRGCVPWRSQPASQALQLE